MSSEEQLQAKDAEIARLQAELNTFKTIEQDMQLLKVENDHLHQHTMELESLKEALEIELKELEANHSEEIAYHLEQTQPRTHSESEQSKVLTMDEKTGLADELAIVREAKAALDMDLKRLSGELETAGEQHKTLSAQLRAQSTEFAEEKDNLQEHIRSLEAQLLSQYQTLDFKLHSLRQETAAEKTNLQEHISSLKQGNNEALLKLSSDLSEMEALKAGVQEELNALKVQHGLATSQAELAQSHHQVTLEQVKH